MADKKPEKKETSTEAVKKVDKKLPFFKRIGKWFRDMKSELKKVVWPTPKQTANNTAVCLVVMFVSALVLWGLVCFPRRNQRIHSNRADHVNADDDNG